MLKKELEWDQIVAEYGDGETVGGFDADGNRQENIRWKCQYEMSMIEPKREVLDVNTGESISRITISILLFFLFEEFFSQNLLLFNKSLLYLYIYIIVQKWVTPIIMMILNGYFGSIILHFVELPEVIYAIWQ